MSHASPPLPSDDKRWKIVNGTMRRHGFARDALIETMHTVQSSFGFLDDVAIRFLAKSLRVPLSQACGVATFYNHFTLKPAGNHTCTVCLGTACYIKGADKLLAQAERRLKIRSGQTTPDGNISLMTARCVGACGRAPVILQDNELQGYIYVRAEDPLAVTRMTASLQQARRRGLLGNNICGTTFVFDIEIRLGAGAFVCGEETALIASMEGLRGQPRPRPPYPAVSGLRGSPTLINNVETFANVPPIIRNGAEWYASIGTEKSKGTRVFAFTGKIQNTGLIEVPMGLTLREIIFSIGGVPNGRKFKAVQTGGPSGGAFPKSTWICRSAMKRSSKWVR